VHTLDNCCRTTADCFFELIEGFFTKKACISESFFPHTRRVAGTGVNPSTRIYPIKNGII